MDRQVICSRCDRQPQKSLVTGDIFVTYICYPHCGNVFWTQRSCQKCKVQNYTRLIKKPKTGERITCQKCSFQCYYFRCPYKQCRALMFKSSGLYRMGQATSCTECQKYFKLIVCSCGGEIYLDQNHVIHQGMSQFDCKQCKGKVIYAICPQCSQIDYFFEKQQIGQKIKCSHCKKTRNFVPCPNCGKSILSKNFHYGQMQTCNYCNVSFQFVQCPNGCGANYFFSQNMTNPMRHCQGCQVNFIVINCNKCKHPLYIQNYQFQYSREEQCPACKNQIKFHLCTCGLLSLNSNKCINPTCALPKGVKNYSKEWNQLNKKKTTQPNSNQNENFTENQCKLCYDANSCMVNETCRHMMMCQQCFRGYRTREIGQNIRCPVCRQPGKFHKFIKPILQ